LIKTFDGISGSLLIFSTWSKVMTQISPMLAVSNGSAAIDFYKAAFGAQLLWHLGAEHDVIAGLSIGGANFFLAPESPDFGTRNPASAGFTTVRIELFVDDPVEIHRKAVSAGAVQHSPVQEHLHNTIGPQPVKRMLQGAVVDPFGHLWLIGKFLD
jgi:PhnB protein